MNRLSYFAASIAITGVMLTPLSASAVYFSFGGTIIDVNYCANGAINVIIKPAGIFPISYMWTPWGTFTTFVPPVPAIPPVRPAVPPIQQVLGLYLAVPYVCVGPGKHPLSFTGFPMIIQGLSPL